MFVLQIVMLTHRVQKQFHGVPSFQILWNVDKRVKVKFQFNYEFRCAFHKKECPCTRGRIGVYADAVSD